MYEKHACEVAWFLPVKITSGPQKKDAGDIHTYIHTYIYTDKLTSFQKLQAEGYLQQALSCLLHFPKVTITDDLYLQQLETDWWLVSECDGGNVIKSPHSFPCDPVEKHIPFHAHDCCARVRSCTIIDEHFMTHVRALGRFDRFIHMIICFCTIIDKTFHDHMRT